MLNNIRVSAVGNKYWVARISIFFLSLLFIAATWRGVFDTDPHDNPRSMQTWEIAAFITSVVNPQLRAPIWSPGDTVTLCQGGSNVCAIVAYIPGGTNSWAFARETNSRSKPPEASVWEKFWKWLLPSRSIPNTIAALNSYFDEWEDSIPNGVVYVGELIPDNYKPSNEITSCISCHN